MDTNKEEQWYAWDVKVVGSDGHRYAHVKVMTKKSISPRISCYTGHKDIIIPVPVDEGIGGPTVWMDDQDKTLILDLSVGWAPVVRSLEPEDYEIYQN